MMGVTKVQSGVQSGAYSQAGRLSTRRKVRARRGRPFIAGKLREPNGRISRARTPHEPADRLALNVRAGKMGVGVEQARDPRLASYAGRLAMLGAAGGGLSAAQYDAVQKFLEIRNGWARAILSPGAVWEGDEDDGAGGGEDADAVARRAVARYEAAMVVVRRAQDENPHDNLYAALQHLVIEDRELPHMIGTLRLALNALHRHFF